MDTPTTIIKRSGDSVTFDDSKIYAAVLKAMYASKEMQDPTEQAKIITRSVVASLVGVHRLSIELVQDAVEMELMAAGLYATAKKYILYRAERAKLRDKMAGESLISLYQDNSSHFDHEPMREFVYFRTYSRWLERQGRREVWAETVDRYMNYMRKTLGAKLDQADYSRVREAILTQKVMPSMRLLQFAGEAVDRCNLCAYNCSYIAPKSLRDIAEVMYISMSGSGCGWSVETKNLQSLPIIQPQHGGSIDHHVVPDDREGWCDSLHLGLETWFSGGDIVFDYSKVRPAGARLKTMGGRASGPGPLKALLEFSRKMVLESQGRRLTSLQLYDLLCKIGQIVVAGGVRRCLAQDSQVLTVDGIKPIQEVRVGDRVRTHHGWKPVTAVFIQGPQTVLSIHHDLGVTQCTSNHRVAVHVPELGGVLTWLPAGELTTQHQLVNGDRAAVSINSIQRDGAVVPTYDLEVEDDHCFVCDGVLVHNSAMISLSDLKDTDIRDAKSGSFWLTNDHRSMANNSAVYTQKPDMIEFMAEWLALAQSGTGERGIFNRGGLVKVLPERRLAVLGSKIDDMGTNPCGEILLQSKGLCNLTEVVCRASDTAASLKEKIEIATIIGTYQSTLSKFRYLSDEWKANQEQERLLGVSLTGQCDCSVAQGPEFLTKLREHAIAVNRVYAEKFGINPSTAITTIKPSGTVSQMVNSASGMHPRFSDYYIRRIRVAASDPLCRLMRDQGYPCVPEVGQTEDTATTYVLSFPIKSPPRGLTCKDISALDQLELWKLNKLCYTEHNPSVTIYIKPDEWLRVGQWVWYNWDIITGLSFLPYTEHIYQLAPYETINREEYDRMVTQLPKVNFSKLLYYETVDQTDVKREVACTGDKCEL